MTPVVCVTQPTPTFPRETTTSNASGTLFTTSGKNRLADLGCEQPLTAEESRRNVDSFVAVRTFPPNCSYYATASIRRSYSGSHHHVRAVRMLVFFVSRAFFSKLTRHQKHRRQCRGQWLARPWSAWIRVEVTASLAQTTETAVCLWCGFHRAPRAGNQCSARARGRKCLISAYFRRPLSFDGILFLCELRVVFICAPIYFFFVQSYCKNASRVLDGR